VGSEIDVASRGHHDLQWITVRYKQKCLIATLVVKASYELCHSVGNRLHAFHPTTAMRGVNEIVLPNRLIVAVTLTVPDAEESFTK
jgi:hypothetical protein